MRNELENFADIMFSGRPADRAFWLGEKAGADREFIEKNYRVLKPCLHGSDAHHDDGIGMPDHDRFCWMKGDLTFETPRQAVVEPAERVWIAAQPPSYAIPALTIQKAVFAAAPWMKQGAVELNGGLVAIVGARGSGKTALADIVAMGAHAKDAGNREASFLKRAFMAHKPAGQCRRFADVGGQHRQRRRLYTAGSGCRPTRIGALSVRVVCSRTDLWLYERPCDSEAVGRSITSGSGLAHLAVFVEP